MVRKMKIILTAIAFSAVLFSSLFSTALCSTSFAQQVTLYDFYSPTCGPCRRMEPVVQQLSAAGFPVRKVNIVGSPDEQALAAKFRVQKVPTFITTVDGREVDRLMGATTYSHLEQMVRHASQVARDSRPPRNPVAPRLQSPDGATPLPSLALPRMPSQTASQTASQIVPQNNPWASVPGRSPAQSAPRAPAWPAANQQPHSHPQSNFQESNSQENGHDCGNDCEHDHSHPLATNPLAALQPAAVIPAAVIPKTTIPAAASPVITSADADLLRATVRLRVEDGNSHSWGTGTIIDARSGEALIITCGHIFRDSQGKGPVTVELFDVTPQGVRVSERVAGQVISFDLDRDIGLVSIRPKQTVRAVSVASSGAEIIERSRVASVGCDHGADPTVRHSHITALNRYLGAPNIEVAGAPVEGRSGGGLFSASGELIGICNAADPEGDEGLFAGLPSVHQELDNIGLAAIYRGNQPATQPVAQPPIPFAAANSPPVQPQPNRMLQAVGPPKAISLTSGGVAQPRTNEPPLSAVEQAAWEEIMGRATEAEVVCIIRPKTPGGKSEVITLNNVSAEFVRRLVDRQAPQRSPRPATAPTSYPVSR